jgi:hypothetical protein
MMKRKLLLVTGLLLGVFAYSQPNLTLRAYKQVVFPGTVPVRISEDNASTARVGKKASTTYYLYLVYPQKETVLPNQVWINKKAYALKTEPVVKTPVEHIGRNIPTRPVTTVLVPKTSNRVLRLQPVAATGNPVPVASAQKLIDTSELVVRYKWKGKIYYKAVKKITEMEPEMME